MEDRTRSTAKPRTVLWRIALYLVAVIAWLAIAGVGGPTFGKLSEVQSNDQASFLPASAEATKALDWQEKFRDSEAIPAVVVIADEAGIAPKDVPDALERLDTLDALEGEVIGPIPSEDGKALEIIVPLDPQADTAAAVDEVRALVEEELPASASAYVTGPAGFSADLKEAFSGIDGVLLGVALAAVFVILLLVYRSLLLPLIVLSTSVMALCAAILAVYYMALAGWIRLDGQSQGILSILVIGAATDYSLLFVARHREALSTGAGRWQAVTQAWRGCLEPVLASGGTVTVGLLCLLFSDLNSNRALGPIGASGIVFSVIAALTFLPAALGLVGRSAYWPVLPKPSSAHHAAADRGLWAWVARLVRRRHRTVWISCCAVLLIGAAGITGLQAHGVAQSDLVLGESQARTGQQVLGEHFPAGSGSPASVVLPEEQTQSALELIDGAAGVDSVTLQAEGGAPVGSRPGAQPQVIDGMVLGSITLSDAADSEAAKETVLGLRVTLHELDPQILVGGSTATMLDTAQTAEEDLVKIIPLTLAAILLILMLLLRSILAPVLLIVTTVLSYGTAMGVSALVFNHVFKFPGADPSVPLFGFVFLVALGVDYNIFLMTRVREETLQHGTAEGMSRGLRATGGVITSAGVVLAATFAALGVIPIMFLVQLGFIVAFGVLLDTLIVRSLLVPALVHQVGSAIWWPSKLMRRV
ncbi:efflux RND transporter permease subunit [Glutamicibacter sp. PS]|uniref:MMPL family transporter n=1 Tax=Glutamicibacter sp. PS TaxID=3075634 RepID=UPI0028504F4D|nr:efflux RND transporter permease subunit [Glutamicibacter sp. PS]MDR4532026.1 efflux RND transporter permease subunit [Glutamicibacter sp. PS]